MRLKEINFLDKRDIIVFKCLMRAIKEEKNTNVKYLNKNVKKRCFHKIIERCYLSRKAHKNETFETNISYWPDDCGDLFHSNMTRLIYFSLLICSLNPRIGSPLFRKFIDEYNMVLSTPDFNFAGSYKIKVRGYYQLFLESFIKCGYEEKIANDKVEILFSLLDAIEYNIPF